MFTLSKEELEKFQKVAEYAGNRFVGLGKLPIPPGDPFKIAKENLELHQAVFNLVGEATGELDLNNKEHQFLLATNLYANQSDRWQNFMPKERLFLAEVYDAQRRFDSDEKQSRFNFYSDIYELASEFLPNGLDRRLRKIAGTSMFKNYFKPAEYQGLNKDILSALGDEVYESKYADAFTSLNFNDQAQFIILAKKSTQNPLTLEDMNALLSQATDSSHFISDTQWDMLKQRLGSLTKIRDNLSAAAEWKKALSIQQREKLAYLETQQTYNNLMQGFGVINQLGQLTHNKDLQRFAAIATKVAQGGAAVMAMAGQIPMAILGMTNPIGLMFTLTSSVLGIFGAFGKSNNHSSKMLAALFQEIRFLSDLVMKFREEVHLRFDRLEKMELTTQKMILGLYDELRENFSFLHHTLTVPALKNFSELEKKISAQFDKLNAKINLIELQPLIRVIFETRPYLEGTVSASKMEERQFTNHMSILAGYLTDTVKDPTHTHQVILDSNFASDHARRTYDALNAINLDDALLPNYIGLILGYVNSISNQHFAADQDDIFNVIVWYKALQAYTNLRRKFPHFDYDANHEQVKMIADQAKQLQAIMTKLRSSEFINFLWREYRAAENEIDKIFAEEVEAVNALFIAQQPEILKNNAQTVHLLTEVNEYLTELHDNKAVPLNPNLNDRVNLEWVFYPQDESSYNLCANLILSESINPLRTLHNNRQISIQWRNDGVDWHGSSIPAYALSNPLLSYVNQTGLFDYLRAQNYGVPPELLLIERLGLGNFTSTMPYSFMRLEINPKDKYLLLNFNPSNDRHCYLRLYDGNEPMFGLSTKLALSYEQEKLTVTLFEPKKGFLFDQIFIPSKGFSLFDAVVHTKLHSEIRLGYRSGKLYGDEWELFKQHLKDIVLIPKNIDAEVKKIRSIIESHFMKARRNLAQTLIARLDKSPEIYRFYAIKQLLISSSVLLGFPISLIADLYQTLQLNNEFIFLNDYVQQRANTSTPFRLNIPSYDKTIALHDEMLSLLFFKSIWCDTKGLCQINDQLIAVIDNYLALGLLNIGDMQMAVVNATTSGKHKSPNTSDPELSFNLEQKVKELSQKLDEQKERYNQMELLLKFMAEKMGYTASTTTQSVPSLPSEIQNHASDNNVPNPDSYYELVNDDEAEEETFGDQKNAEQARQKILREVNQPQEGAASDRRHGWGSGLASVTSTLFSWMPRSMPSLSIPKISEQKISDNSTLLQQPILIKNKNIRFDYGKYDDQSEHDSQTNEPTFTYRVYRDGAAVGSMRLYGQPMICTDAAYQYNNILETTGELSDFTLTREMDMQEICRVLPPSMLDRVLLSAKNSALSGATQGAMRGGANVVGLTLQSVGTSKTIADYISQSIYFLGFFTLRCHHYLAEVKVAETTDYLSAIYKAAVDTGQVLLTQVVLNKTCELLQSAGDFLVNKGWNNTGVSMQRVSYLANKFGILGWNSYQQGAFETSASAAKCAFETTVSIATGALVQTGIEQSATAGINYINR